MWSILIQASIIFVFFIVPIEAAYSLQSLFLQEKIIFLDIRAPDEKFVHNNSSFTEEDRVFAKKKFIESTNKATAILIRLEALAGRIEKVANSEESKILLDQIQVDIREARLERDRMVRAFESVFASENPAEAYREIRNTHEAAFLQHIRHAFFGIEKLSIGDLSS